jgi:uncharacterized cupredoxin-like copper-binding protein
MSWLLRSALLLGLAASPATAAPDWSVAEMVAVVTVEYRFAPQQLSFKRGVAYRLHIENRGKEMHEFTAPEFFRSVEIRDPAALNADRTEIEIAPGAAKDLFFVPRQAGHFPLRCADHDWAGMVGGIAVQ